MSAATGYHEEEILGKAYDASLMRRLLKYTRPYRWVIVLAVLLLVINALLATSLAFITKTGIDDHIMTGKMEGFANLALLYMGIIIVFLLASYAQIYVTVWLGQKVQHDIRMQLFRHLQRLHLSFYDRNPVGRMVTRVTNDVNTLNELFSSGVVNIIGDVLMLVFFVAALVYVNWKLALVTFVSLPLLIVATFVFRARARDAYRVVRLKVARLNAFVQEHITGMSIVQLFTREKATYGKFDDINRDLRGAHFRSVVYYAVFYPTVEIIGALSVGLLFYYGGRMINMGTLSYGELVLFIYLVERFFHPIRDLSEKYNILQASMASSERIFKLLDTPPQITDRLDAREPTQFRGGLDVKNLWFAYKGEDWVLRDVSFSVAPGEKVAIVGATGAGKTSLISLLYRFYDYQKGSISVDGTDIRDYPVESLRSLMGLVLQDVYIFSGDYARNVRLRRTDISDEAVRQALQRVGFNRFIRSREGAIHTEVKERGATLSTGQKQLLSFARALAFDPGILILDEATSSVDTETETLIQKALDELLKGRTSIIIAHRLSTIEKADKIVVLHHGQLREMGKHEELLKKGGIYHKLYQLQYKKQDISADSQAAVAGG
ncbi:MAG: ABC transporter ATP-binding protein [Candidatus Zixiibacteriota bacterium]|nr:MAG: ABC transporter ATP-binding protein [candidate division Zixibacteria bacterium]